MNRCQGGQQSRLSPVHIRRVLRFQRQLDRVGGIVEVWIRSKQQFGKVRKQLMKDGCDLAFVRLQKDLTELKRRLTECLFDSFELALQDFGNTRENVDIFDGNDGKPHALSTNQPGALRNVCHTQIAVD